MLSGDAPRSVDDPDLEAATANIAMLPAATLLSSGAPRSEHDPDDAAAASIAMHPVTGAFANPSHESACAAQLFRMAFPCHAFLMALSLAISIWTSLSVPTELWPLESVAAFCTALGLIGRVLVHRMDDTVRGQCLGSWTWTALVVLGVTIYFIPTKVSWPVTLHDGWTIQAVTGSLVNGSHGLGFWHKLGLIGLMLVDGLWAIGSYGKAALGNESMLVVGFVVAHMAEMHLRHSYVEKQRQAKDYTHRLAEEKRLGETLEERNEQLRAEKERLLYDVQRRGRPLDDDDDRSAIRRGLQAGPSQQPLSTTGDTSSSDLSGAKPASDSPTPSLPPGPPSSTSSGSTAPPLTWAKPTAPPPTWAEPDRPYYGKSGGRTGGSTRAALTGPRPTAPPELELLDDDGSHAPSSTSLVGGARVPTILRKLGGMAQPALPPSCKHGLERRSRPRPIRRTSR